MEEIKLDLYSATVGDMCTLCGGSTCENKKIHVQCLVHIGRAGNFIVWESGIHPIRIHSIVATAQGLKMIVRTVSRERYYPTGWLKYPWGFKRTPFNIWVCLCSELTYPSKISLTEEREIHHIHTHTTTNSLTNLEFTRWCRLTIFKRVQAPGGMYSENQIHTYIYNNIVCKNIKTKPSEHNIVYSRKKRGTAIRDCGIGGK